MVGDDSVQLQQSQTAESPVVLDVLANDFSPSGGLTITSVQSPAHGSASMVSADPNDPMSHDRLSIAVDAAFTGTEWFTYKVSDADGDQATATVAVTVLAPNDPPQVTNLRLVNDTGTAGDNVTSDPTVTGTLTDDGFNSSGYGMSMMSSTYAVQIDLGGDGSVERTLTPNADHTFDYDPRGDGQPHGVVTVQARAVETVPGGRTLSGDWQTLTFTSEAPATGSGSADGDGSSAQAGDSSTEDPWDWQSAVAETEADYQQAKQSADSEFAAGLQSTADRTQAALEQRDADVATLQAESATQLQAALDAAQTTTEDANKSRDERIADVGKKLQDRSQKIDAKFEKDSQAARDEMTKALDKLQKQHDEAAKKIEDDFNAATVAAQAALDSSLSTVESAYQSTVDEAQATYDAATQAADTAYTAAAQAAWDALVASSNGIASGYEAALAAAAVQRDAVLAGTAVSTRPIYGSGGAAAAAYGTAASGTPVTTVFDETLIAQDAGYQSILYWARLDLSTEFDKAVGDFHTQMQLLRVAYDTDLLNADNAFTEAIATANSDYQRDAQTAFDGYNTAIDTAVDDFNGQVAELQTAFDTAVNLAAENYGKQNTKADTDYDKEIADSQKAYDDTVNPAKLAYDKFKAEEPKKLANSIREALKVWTTLIAEAVAAKPGAVNSASVAHLDAVHDALQAIAELGTDDLRDKATAGMAEVNTVALEAKAAYDAAMSAPIGTFANYDDMMVASSARQRAAVLAYVTTVGNKLVSEADTLAGDLATSLQETYTAVATAVKDTGAADVIQATAIKTAEMAVQKAFEVGQAKFMQTNATLQEAYFAAAKSNETKYRNIVVTAEMTRDNAKVTAEKNRSIAHSTAGKAYVDSVAVAEKSYVDNYADKWKAMHTTFDTAATDLADQLVVADEAWVKAANEADEAWVESAKTAATTYNTAAAEAPKAAHTRAHTAVQTFVATVEPAWEAAVRAAYPAAPDVEQYLDASRGFTQAGVDAWIAADDALVGLENGYDTAVVEAANSQLVSTADAAHAQTKSEIQAECDALVQSTAARVSYDTSYTNAAVTKAKASVAEQTQLDQDRAAAAKKENDKLAAAYATAVQGANNLYREVVTESNTQIDGTVQEFIANSFANAKALQKQAETLATSVAAEMIADATAQATALQDRLVAAAKKLGADRTAEILKAFKNMVNDIRQKLDALSTAADNDLYNYQTSAGHAQIPFGDLTMMAWQAINVRSDIQAKATELRQGILNAKAIAEFFPGMNAGGGPSATAVFDKMFGTLRWEIKDADGQRIGMYDATTGKVQRSALSGTGVANLNLPLADVQAEMAKGLKTTTGWDKFFGAKGVIDNDPPKSWAHWTMNLVISDVRLQAPGDIGSDLLLSAELATEIVSVFDPTGIADAIGGTIKLSQGDHTGAALSYASILVPFGADKIAKSVARVPTTAVEATLKVGQNLGENALKTIAKSTDNIAEATLKQSDTLAKVDSCPTGAINCFIAGTQAVMRSSRIPFSEPNGTTVSPDTDGPAPEQAVPATDVSAIAAVAAVGLGVGLAVAKNRLKANQAPALLPRRRHGRRRPEHVPAEPVMFDKPQPSATDLPPVPATVAAGVPVAMQPTRGWLTKSLTAAMLVCFMAGGWLAAQSALKSNGQAYSSPVAPPTGASVTAEPQYLTKNIEDVQKGDFVLARDEHGKEIGYRKVVEVYRRTSFHLRHLKFRDQRGHYQELSTTDEHPFLDAESNKFVNAGNLTVHSKVTAPDGQLQTLVLTKREEHPEGVPVFNFQVEGFHTYYVHQPGASVPVLVHNADYPMTPDQIALKELVSEASLGGRKALDADTANTILDWADKVNYPGWRASANDLNPVNNHWVNGPHIHIPGTGSHGIPVLPGVTPR